MLRPPGCHNSMRNGNKSDLKSSVSPLTKLIKNIAELHKKTEED